MEKIRSIIGIDHIGYAVKDMDEARKIFIELGYEFTKSRVDELRKVNVAIGVRDGVRIELLAPLDGIKSPIDGYLQKVGSIPYHICYKVDDMTAVIERLNKIGFTQLGVPTPSCPLGGDVCFMYSPIIGIVEIICY